MNLGHSFFKLYSMTRKVFLIVSLCVVAFLTSCKQGNKVEEKEKSSLEQYMEDNCRFDTSMQRTSEDSTAVIALATEFLNLLSKNDAASALDMLYDRDDEELIPLSAERRQQLQQVFRAFPVLSYKIDGFDFFSDDDSQVKYSYHFMESTDENLPTSTTGVLNLYRREGKWYLSIPRVKAESL